MPLQSVLGLPMPALEDAKLELFCQERAKAGATDVSAYAAAGYSVKGPNAYENISRVLKDPEVSRRIAQIHVEAAGCDVTLEKVKQQLCYIAFTDMADILEWGSTVVRSRLDKVTGERKVVIVRKEWCRLIDSSELDPRAAVAIRKVWSNEKGMGVTLREPIPALAALGAHLGMWPMQGRRGFSRKRRGAFRDPHPAPLYPAHEPIPPNETQEEWEARQRRRMERILGAARQKASAPTATPSH